MNRKRQSNPVEYCPICLKRLTARFAAASHYNKHVKAGEIEKRGNGEGAIYRIITDDPFQSAWWRTGLHNWNIQDRIAHIPTDSDRKQYLIREWKKEHRFGS